MATIHVPYGVKGTLDLEIDDKNLVLDTDREFPGELENLEQAVIDALENPVAGAPFSERVSQAETVCILTDNFARLTNCCRRS